MTTLLQNLIETNKKQLAKDAAQEVIARQILGYSTLKVEDLAQELEQSLTMIIAYLKEADLDAITTYAKRTVDNAIMRGFTIEALRQRGAILMLKIKELIDQSLPSEANAITRRRYHIAIDSLSQLGQHTNTKKAQ